MWTRGQRLRSCELVRADTTMKRYLDITGSVFVLFFVLTLRRIDEWDCLVIEGTCLNRREGLGFGNYARTLKERNMLCVYICYLHFCSLVCNSTCRHTSSCLLKTQSVHECFPVYNTTSPTPVGSLCSTESVYDPILVLSHCLKIELWFVQQWRTGGRGQG